MALVNLAGAGALSHRVELAANSGPAVRTPTIEAAPGAAAVAEPRPRRKY
jgi:hypothetical protein